MKRTTALGVTLVATILTTGCPFESQVPLGGPRPGSRDPRLEGRWVVVENGVAVVEADFLPFDETEYYVELREQGKEPQRYRAYTVLVGGEPFLNVNEIKGDPARRSFNFARYGVGSDGTLALRLVGDKAVPKALGADQKALVKFLAGHLEGGFLDDAPTPLLLHRPAAPGGTDKAGPSPTR